MKFLTETYKSVFIIGKYFFLFIYTYPYAFSFLENRLMFVKNVLLINTQKIKAKTIAACF